MITIRDKSFTFIEFFKELISLLDKGAILRDVVIERCTITEIPNGFEPWVLIPSKKFMGLTIYKSNGKFFALECDNVTVMNCTFTTIDYENENKSRDSF